MTAHTTDGGPAFPVHDLQAAQPSSMNDLNAMARGMSLREADAEIERLRARVASLEESLHYANGTADLAMKHRDDAEKRVAELERDRVHAGVDICEVAAAVEVVRVMEIVKEVAGVVANLHEGPFRHGFEAACEEIEHRLRPCEHCDTALAKDGA